MQSALNLRWGYKGPFTLTSTKKGAGEGFSNKVTWGRGKGSIFAKFWLTPIMKGPCIKNIGVYYIK